MTDALFYTQFLAFLGPAIGSFLYSLGGFGLPFYFTGSIALVLGVMLFFAIPNLKQVSKEHTDDALYRIYT